MMTEIETLKEIIEENHIRITNIKHWLETNSSANHSNCHKNINKIEVTNKVLGKQIPKQPTKDYVVPELDFCPICGTEVTGCGYCPNCGQRIDFGE